MGTAYPHLVAERENVRRWVGDEEQAFGRTLDRGTELLARLIDDAKRSNTSWIDASEAFRLHDTYGFPYDLTKELLAEQGLSVDDDGFEVLMEQQRERARAGVAPVEDRHETVISFVGAAPRVGLRRLRGAQRANQHRRGAAPRGRRRRRGPGQARGEPVLPRGRRAGGRLGRRRLGRGGGGGRGRLPGWR